MVGKWISLETYLIFQVVLFWYKVDKHNPTLPCEGEWICNVQVLLQGGEFHTEQLLHVERPAWSEVTWGYM